MVDIIFWGLIGKGIKSGLKFGASVAAEVLTENAIGKFLQKFSKKKISDLSITDFQKLMNEIFQENGLDQSITEEKVLELYKNQKIIVSKIIDNNDKLMEYHNEVINTIKDLFGDNSKSFTEVNFLLDRIDLKLNNVQEELSEGLAFLQNTIQITEQNITESIADSVRIILDRISESDRLTGSSLVNSDNKHDEILRSINDLHENQIQQNELRNFEIRNQELEKEIINFKRDQLKTVSELLTHLVPGHIPGFLDEPLGSNEFILTSFDLQQHTRIIGYIEKIEETSDAFSEHYLMSNSLINDWFAQRAFYLSGIFWQFFGDPQRAIRHFERIKEITPVLNSDGQFAFSEKKLLFVYSSTLFDLQEYYKAISVLEDIKLRYPRYVIIYNNLAQSYSRLGHIDKSIEILKLGIELSPNSAILYYNLGSKQGIMGQYEDSIQNFKLATNLQKNFPIAYINWGYALNLLDRPEEAILKYKLTEQYERSATLYNNWGVSLSKLNRFKEANEKYYKSLTFVKSANTYFNLGNNLTHMKEFDSALKNIIESEKLDDTQWDLYLLWGNVLKQQKSYDLAIKKFEKGTHLNPTAIVLYDLWGTTLMLMGKHDEAIRIYNIANEMEGKKQFKFD